MDSHFCWYAVHRDDMDTCGTICIASIEYEECCHVLSNQSWSKAESEHPPAISFEYARLLFAAEAGANLDALQALGMKQAKTAENINNVNLTLAQPSSSYTSKTVLHQKTLEVLGLEGRTSTTSNKSSSDKSLEGYYLARSS